MLSQVQTKTLDQLFESISQDLECLDIFLSHNDEVFSEAQQLLDNEKTFSLVTLEEEDLQSQQSILSGLYQVFFEELPEDNADPLEIIEAIEDEVGEVQTCVLVVDGFSNCNKEAQTSLLELVIVSKVFKLLLRVNENFDVDTNENLWGVLNSRSTFLNQEDFPLDEVESSTTSAAAKKWYQLLPRYHLLAGAALVLLVVGLWNMDITQKKEENIDLNLQPQPSDQSIAEENESSIEQQDQGGTQVQEALTIEYEEKNSENGQDNIVVEPERSQQETEIEVVELPVEEIAEKPEVSALNEQSKISQSTVLTQAVDWSPYQSNLWINGLNKKYYTLQLMASHNAAGIRDFLSERGVNSQYAVYTAQKNGKPWHVIIYGVYENHEFANAARENLPTYLKNYSPWIRSVADVQGSLK